MCGQGVMTSWVQCHQSSGMRHIVPLAVSSRQVIVNPVRSLDVLDHVIVPSPFCFARKVVIFSGGRLSVVQHRDLSYRKLENPMGSKSRHI